MDELLLEKGLLCVSERTMSDLQIGQVRRRVVSQGVLLGSSVLSFCLEDL